MEINLTIDKISEVLGTKASVKDSFIVARIKSLEDAGPQDMSIVFDRGERSVFDNLSDEKIKNSKAGIILSDRNIDGIRRCIIVDNSLSAFEKIVDYVKSKKTFKDPIIDTTAVIAKTAIISSGSKIGKYTIIGDFVFIGERCVIEDNVKILPGAKILYESIIKSGTTIHPGAVIGVDGFGYVLNKQNIRKIPQVGKVVLEENVEIGANSTIERAAFNETKIGTGTKIDSNVHIAHNTVIGEHTIILSQTAIGGSVVIGNECQIGAQVAIKDHVVIGNNVKIVSKSGIMKNVEDNEIVCGIPAVSFGTWKRSNVLITMLTKHAKDIKSIIPMLKQEK